MCWPFEGPWVAGYWKKGADIPSGLFRLRGWGSDGHMVMGFIYFFPLCDGFDAHISV